MLKSYLEVEGLEFDTLFGWCLLMSDDFKLNERRNMTSNTFHVLGVEVDGPPSGAFLGGQRSDLQHMMSGETTPYFIFKASGFQFQEGNATPVNTTSFAKYTSQSGVNINGGGGGWTFNGLSQVYFDVDAEADIDGVKAHIRYCCEAAGTHEGTSAGIVVSSPDVPEVSRVAWKINTNQPDYVWIESPEFALRKGTNSLTFYCDVAVLNSLSLSSFDLLPPSFEAKPVEVSFYWKCIHSGSILPGGSYKMTKAHTVGVSKESSSTVSVAKELGLSVGASFASISAGLNMSLKKTVSKTNSISLTETRSVVDETTYPNNKDTDMQLTLWQPCVVYKIGNVTLIDEQGDTLIARESYT